MFVQLYIILSQKVIGNNTTKQQRKVFLCIRACCLRRMITLTRHCLCKIDLRRAIFCSNFFQELLTSLGKTVLVIFYDLSLITICKYSHE